MTPRIVRSSSPVAATTSSYVRLACAIRRRRFKAIVAALRLASDVDAKGYSKLCEADINHERY
jgi:hypothetical protein